MIDVLYGKDLINHAVVTTEMTTTDTSSQTSSNSGEGGNLLESGDETSTNSATTEDETTDGAATTQEEIMPEENTAVEEGTPEENTTTDTTTEGETGTENSGDTAVDPGEMQPDIIDDSGNSEVTGDMSYDMSGMEGMEAMGGEGTTVKDPFLSSYVPVIGITAATFVVGAVVGILLAKKKIKKGIDLYED